MGLNLGLLIFSFITTGVLIIPFINLLYRLKFTRRKEAPRKGTGKISAFDKLHDIKAGTPVGGGIVIIFVVSILFAVIFPTITKMGVFISVAYDTASEINIIFFTFLSFGLLGLYDDFVKLFRKPQTGKMGMWVGLGRKQKFAFQWVLALIIGFLIYQNLGIQIIHIPILETVITLGPWYILFAAFIIVVFVNALNITDGLDGLATGLLVICLFAFWIIAASVFDTPLSIFISLWIGSLVAFLYFNIFPARAFLGDSGALAFGGTLAVIGLLSGKIFILGVIGGLFLIEAATSIIQIFGWKFLHRPIFPIAPAHLWFQIRGWREPTIVMRWWLAGIMLAIFGLWLALI